MRIVAATNRNLEHEVDAGRLDQVALRGLGEARLAGREGDGAGEETGGRPRLRLNEAAVEKYLYRGLKQLADAMRGPSRHARARLPPPSPL